ncbi:UNVERIFIED_CONTAM: hypothetical protein K2H54_070820, partial [Gekko kuhli]
PPVSYEEVAVSFTLGKWAVLDAGRRKLYWEVLEDKYATVTSLVAGVKEMASEKERGRGIVEGDEDLDVEVESGAQVIRKRQQRRKREAQRKQRKELTPRQSRKTPEVPAQDKIQKRKRRQRHLVKAKGFSWKSKSKKYQY